MKACVWHLNKKKSKPKCKNHFKVQKGTLTVNNAKTTEDMKYEIDVVKEHTSKAL